MVDSELNSFSILDLSYNINEIYDSMVSSIVKSLPVKEINMNRYKGRKQNKLLWMDDSIQVAVKDKNHNYKDFKRGMISWDEYKVIRNKVNKKVLACKMEYDKKILSDAKNNKNSLYKLMRKASPQAPAPDMIEDCNGYIISDSKEIAELFADEYKSVDQSEHLYVADVSDCLMEMDIDVTTNEEEVYNIIMNCKNSKVAGPDAIPMEIIKNHYGFFVWFITLLYNLSITRNEIPGNMLLSNIVLKYKKGIKCLLNSYRYINITNSILKILEKIILVKMEKSLVALDKKYTFQHGFTNNKSCTSNLLQSIDRWSFMRDRGNAVIVVYLDFEKAFDNVDHKILLCKLADHQVPGKIIKWISLYLKNRKFRVQIGNDYSNWYYARKGVPQGSTLAGYLFKYFIADICEGIKSEVICYADDLKIYAPVKSIEDVQALQVDLNLLEEWSVNNKLYFNLEKCSVLVLGDIKFDHALYLGGKMINQVEFQKDLGIYVDRNLDFVYNSKMKIKMMNCKFYKVKSMFNYLSIELFRFIYKTYILPVIDFGACCSMPLFKKDKILINRCFRRWTKLVYGLQGKSYIERLQILGLPTPLQRFLRGDLIYMFKIIKSNFCAITDLKIINNRCRGHDFKLYHNITHLNLRKNFLTNRSVDIWNNMPEDMVNINSLSLFKTRVDKWLTTNNTYKDLT